MKKCSRLLTLALTLAIFSCDSALDQGFEIFTETTDFSESENDWLTGFSDYPSGVDDSAYYELRHSYTANPVDGEKSVMISGNNHSADLFMYIKKRISGLRPNTEYTLTFDVEFATNATQGTPGAGGSPGESVFFKVGASAMEPRSLIDKEYFVMNIDKGNQVNSGEDMITIGNIAVPNSLTGGYSYVWRNNSSTNATPFVAKSGSDGSMWLIIGTDSGYEGVTTLYYSKVSVVFSASN